MRVQTVFGFMLAALLLPGAISGQTLTSGSIAGVVKDATGAVLPGVTVEAASPALIEKVRTVVTDGQGQYKIVELRPGRYAVTFSLTGFGTVKREGLDLTTGFTATIDAELRVGSIEETVVVSGTGPLVDTQNVRSATLLKREALDTLPTGKSTAGYGALIVGGVTSRASQDVGGNMGESVASITVHNNRDADSKLLIDGMMYNHPMATGGGAVRFFSISQAFVEEIAIETAGMSAESQTAGTQMNAVPKDGGNTFKSTFLTNWTGPALQASNLTDELRARGLATAPRVLKIYDLSGGLGGPIRKNQLWFYTAHRWWGSSQDAPGNYFSKNPNPLFYTPDLSRPAHQDQPTRDNSVRLTWQASDKQRFTFSDSAQYNCYCYLNVRSNRAPEATVHSNYPFLNLAQATWNYPVTNRLLMQAGMTFGRNPFHKDRPKEQLPNAIAITDLTTGYAYGSELLGNNPNDYGTGSTLPQVNGRGSISYVTGSHAFKAGFFFYAGLYKARVSYGDNPVSYAFRNCFTATTPSTGCTPVSVTYWASPFAADSAVRNSALYVQDQWTIKHLTLNLGVRFDHNHAWNPEQTRPAGPYTPSLQIQRQDQVPNWSALSPRLGVAYDLFGNGKTAFKASLGKYMIGESTTLAMATNPANALVTNATRAWNDLNGDFVPQGDELGPLSNNLFGTVQVNTRYAADVLTGFGVRPYTWTGSATFEHELRPGMGISIGYFRSSYGNFTVTDNVAVIPSDYDPYCVTAPNNSGLPGGGGYDICGLYDLSPSKFGQANNVVVAKSQFGKQTEVYNGVDLVFRARFGRGGQFTGGLNTGQTAFDNCAVVDSPQLQFCRYTLPLKGQTQVKFSGTYPLPWQSLEASVVFQNLPGLPIAATRAFSNAELAPSLGRNLSSCPTATGQCAASASVILIEPNTQFEDRLTQVDARLTRSFRIRRTRLQAMLDVYNLFNSSSILIRNNTFGATWGRPTSILAARMFKVGLQFDF